MVEAPDRLPPLPAAVEVAAYRIVQEALNNVLKHAEARTCVIRFDVDADALDVEIRDDGRGLRPSDDPDRRIGVGLHTMRERATEVGGSCAIEPIDGGGTRVRARLPLACQDGMASLGDPAGTDRRAGREGDDAHAGA